MFEPTSRMLPLATSGAVDLLIYCGEILQGFLTTRGG